MKKLLLHIVLISYAATLLKPVMPYVSDFAGHVFFYARHMATAHAENGKWHVHFEAAQNTRNDTEKDNGLPASSKKENTDTGYCLVFTNEEYPVSLARKQQQPLWKNENLLCQDPKKHYPPPRC